MAYKRKFPVVMVAGLVLTLVAMPLLASDRSIRCGTYLIHAGGGKDSAGMYEVLKKCGDPEAKHGNTRVHVHGSMRRILIFNYEGRVQRMESHHH